MNEPAGAQQRMAHRIGRKGWLGGGALLAVAGVGLWLSAATVAQGEGEADVVIAPASKNVALGSGDFTVDVNVENASNLGSYDLLIKFNNDVLEYVGMVKTGYLTTTGRTQQCTSLAGGPSGESPDEYANQLGALVFGCATKGLITDGQGVYGPSGSGTLATLTFRPRGAGQSDIELAGIQERVIVAAPQGEYSGIAGMTQLSAVEQCTSDGDCAPYGIPTGGRSGIVEVYDPSAPTPTGVPATPTRVVPANTPAADATATAPVINRTPSASGTQPAGVTRGGATTSGGTTSGGGTRPGGGVAGASGGATGPDGAPVAGFGPQQESDPWPLRAGMLMTLAGGLIMAGGALSRRTARD